MSRAGTPRDNAVMLIVLFSGIKTKSKLLQTAFTSASKASFSVYIAHGHDIVFMSILGGAFVFLNAYNPITALFVWLGWAFAIYLVIWIIDMIRAVLFKLTKLDLLCDKIGGLIDRFSGFNKA